MMKYTRKTLSIKGYHNIPVPNSFIQQQHETHHLALVLPGIRYPVNGPVLYYPTNLLLAKRADVLHVEYAYYQHPEFQDGSDEERLQWIGTDVVAAYRTAMSERSYIHLTLIGKSLGTLAMGHLLATETLPGQVEAIWLTPLLRHDHLHQQILACPYRSLLMIGTADLHYDAARLSEIQKGTEHETLTIDGADHSLDLEDRVLPSIRVLEKLMCTLERFLSATSLA